VKIIYALNRYIGYVATSFLILMMLLTVVDVAGRYFFNSPITGTTEISKLMMIIVVFPALGWCALARKHVRVELIVSHFSPRVQAIINSIILLIALGIYVIITWRSFLEAEVVNRQTSLLQLSFTPFYWVMSVGFALFCLAIAVMVIENIAEAIKK